MKNFTVTFKVYKYVTQTSGASMILELNGSRVTLTVTRGSRVIAMTNLRSLLMLTQLDLIFSVDYTLKPQ